MLRTIPSWCDLGTEKWIVAEQKRYRFSKCGNPYIMEQKYVKNAIL